MTRLDLLARTRGFTSHQSSVRFADDYEVYVDYGKGRPVKMKENDANFIDVENFLTECIDAPKIIPNKKSNRNSTTNSGRNHNKHQWTTRSERCTSYKSIDRSTLSTPYSHQDSPSYRIGSKIIYDETWPSNKSYNPRVAACIDHIYENINPKPEQISRKHRSTRTNSSYQTLKPPIPRERIHAQKLYLNIAVNGASKSLRGKVPLSNSDLRNGDFGDDAGMVTENGEFCFVGLADGASGNRLLGINPADFSQAILSACRNILRRNPISSNQLPRLIESAIEQVQSNQIHGSSTLCLLALDKKKHRLSTLNIGDSGFVIYRNNRIYHRSTCTMYSEGYGPRQLFALESSFGLPCSFDENQILQCSSSEHVQVQKNDIIILSSDGLWDVIKSNQLQRIIERHANQNLQYLVDDILDQAVRGYALNYRDDILIIVCRVEEF